MLAGAGIGGGQSPDVVTMRTSYPYQTLQPCTWPLIRRFTERVFAEDRMAVEAEEQAWDDQAVDWNQEVLPLIIDVRAVLRTNGVPMTRESAAPGDYGRLCGRPRAESTR
jgi:renierapurpurin 18,18'-hydroxylase